MKETDLQVYQENYSETGLWNKVKKFAKKAGVKVIYLVLLLYYVLQSETVSMLDKGKIYGALGYFILPFDLIPDAIPVVGYTDDLAALVACVIAVSSNITPEIEEKAKAKLSEWFGSYDESELEGLY